MHDQNHAKGVAQTDAKATTPEHRSTCLSPLSTKNVTTKPKAKMSQLDITPVERERGTSAGSRRPPFAEGGSSSDVNVVRSNNIGEMIGRESS